MVSSTYSGNYYIIYISLDKFSNPSGISNTSGIYSNLQIIKFLLDYLSSYS